MLPASVLRNLMPNSTAWPPEEAPEVVEDSEAKPMSLPSWMPSCSRIKLKSICEIKPQSRVPILSTKAKKETRLGQKKFYYIVSLVSLSHKGLAEHQQRCINMISQKIVTYIVAVFTLIYSIRSIIAGIRNEKKSYWLSTRYDGTKEWLKENYDRVWNITFGFIGIFISIALLILFL